LVLGRVPGPIPLSLSARRQRAGGSNFAIGLLRGVVARLELAGEPLVDFFFDPILRIATELDLFGKFPATFQTIYVLTSPSDSVSGSQPW
jgi:hypothetical protein